MRIRPSTTRAQFPGLHGTPGDWHAYARDHEAADATATGSSAVGSGPAFPDANPPSLSRSPIGLVPAPGMAPSCSPAMRCCEGQQRFGHFPLLDFFPGFSPVFHPGHCRAAISSPQPTGPHRRRILSPRHTHTHTHTKIETKKAEKKLKEKRKKKRKKRKPPERPPSDQPNQLTLCAPQSASATHWDRMARGSASPRREARPKKPRLRPCLGQASQSDGGAERTAASARAWVGASSAWPQPHDPIEPPVPVTCRWAWAGGPRGPLGKARREAPRPRHEKGTWPGLCKKHGIRSVSPRVSHVRPTISAPRSSHHCTELH